MCTVTVYRYDGSVVITMNRDERRERHEGEMRQSSELVFPVDLESGGTWCGANAQGLALTLLNRYHETHRPDATSRGGIIPAALRANSIECVASIVQALDLPNYNPFTLWATSRLATVEFVWNGVQLTNSLIEAHPWSIESSSSWETGRVLALRKRRFRQWAADAQASPGTIPDLHLTQQGWSNTDSILMERPTSHTKSICQISLDAQSTGFSYYAQASLEKLKTNPSAPPTAFVQLNN